MAEAQFRGNTVTANSIIHTQVLLPCSTPLPRETRGYSRNPHYRAALYSTEPVPANTV